jgi:hypothetical protein
MKGENGDHHNRNSSPQHCLSEERRRPTKNLPIFNLGRSFAPLRMTFQNN